MIAGKQSIKFDNNVYIKAGATVAGTKERKDRWAAALMSFRKMIYLVVKAGRRQRAGYRALHLRSC